MLDKEPQEKLQTCFRGCCRESSGESLRESVRDSFKVGPGRDVQGKPIELAAGMFNAVHNDLPQNAM